nr:MupA/Atu3671 family FMN-dependent luciferase-like monooxygenase [Burkholderia sp. AcTa6-5]
MADAPGPTCARTLPLTLGQRRLWALERRTPGDSAYHHLSALRLSGPLDENALRVCLQHAVDSHDSLRMRFPSVNGAPVCTIDARRAMPLRRYDLTALDEAAREDALDRLAREEARRAFNLETGPLLRASLLALAPGQFILLLCFHHMVMDGWSLGILLDDIAANYRACTSSGVESRHAGASHARYRIDDYVAHALGATETPAYLASLDYWKRRLAEVSWTQLPYDAPAPAPRRGSRRGRTLRRRFDGVPAALHASAGKLCVTRYQLVLTGFLLYLSQRCASPDVAIATLIANRNESARQQVVGYLANTVVVRHRFEAGRPTAQYVAEVAATVRELLRHGAVSLYSIAQHVPHVVSREPSILFAFQNNPLPPMRLGDVALKPLDVETGNAKFDLSVYVAESEGCLDLWVEYDTMLYREASIEQFVAGFRMAIDALCEDIAHPEASVEQRLADALPLSTLVGPDRAARSDASLMRALLDRAARRPDAIALEAQGTALTFAQMCDGIASVVAALDRLGAMSGERVAILGERNQATLSAIWACLALGLTYVPLARDLPNAKLRLILDDAAPDWLLADAPVRDLPGNWHVISPWLAEPPMDAALAHSTPPALLPAYLLYTSGSTGRPKGVLVSHANLNAFCAAMDEAVPRTQADVWLAVSNLSFDISALELLWAMSRGFRVRVDTLASLCASRAPRTREDAGPLPALGVFYFGSADLYEPDDHLQLLERTAQWADRHGFHALWTPERHFSSFGGFFSNPALTCAHLAALTQRIAIRAGSAIGPLHHTVRLAEDWATIARLSRGRAGISIASGWNPADFMLAARPNAERADTVAQQLRDLKMLWRGEPVPFCDADGRYFEARMPLAPHVDIPLAMTVSNRPEQFEFAAQQGLDVLTHLLEQDVAQLSRNIERYRQTWQACQGDTGRPGRVVLLLHTYVGADDETSAALARPFLARYLASARNALRSLAPEHETHAAQTESELFDSAARRLIAERGLIGGTRTAISRLRQLARIGVDEVACLIDFGPDTEAILASLERLATARAAAGRPAPGNALRPPATHLQCTPSAARLLLGRPDGLPAELETLACWALGGEALEDDLARQARTATDATLLNLYGPTEATIWATRAVILARRAGPPGIGLPLAGVRVHLLDDMLNLVPHGVEGQIHIGGAGVSQGYWRQPALTAQAFIPDPFGPPGARLYATGDYARLTAAGTLAFLGRRDSQVKIQGHRVELMGLRDTLLRHAAVADAYVHRYAGATADAESVVVAFVVPRQQASDELVADLRDHLADYWETGSQPRDIVLVPSIPLTTSQKTDTRRLEALHRDSLANAPSATPAHDDAPHSRAVFAELLDIWRTALPGFDAIQDFHRAGGNSLIALQVLAQANARFGVEVTLRDFYRSPTPAGHLRSILAHGARAFECTLTRVPRQREYATSFAQRAMLILDAMEDAAHGAYHDHVVLDLEGPLSTDSLRRAFAALLQRHRVFTTAYRFEAGDYLQVWRDVVPPDFRIVEAEAAQHERILRAFVDEPFDLAGGRVIRALLLPAGANDHRFCIAIHHVVSDGVTLRLVLDELLRHYQRAAGGHCVDAAEAHWQYIDFADWQRRRVDTRREALEAFWSDRLASGRAAPPTGAAGASPRPGPPPAGHLRIEIGAVATRIVGELVADHHVGELAVLIAPLCLVLKQNNPDGPVTIATDARNRQRPEFEHIPGMMVNQLLLSIRVPDAGGLDDVLQACQAHLSGAFSHQEYPYERLVALSRTLTKRAGTALFDVKFVLNEAREPATVPGFHIVERSLPPRVAKFGILINIARDADRFSGSIVFDSVRYSAEAIRTLWETYLGVLERLPAMVDVREERHTLSTQRIRGDAPPSSAPALLAHLRNAHRQPLATTRVALRVVAQAPDCPVPRIEPNHPGVSLATVIENQQRTLVELVRRHGAVLLRGFSDVTAAGLARVATDLCGELVQYTERSTPRTRLSDTLYTATEYPSHQRIDLHNENAYAHRWPGTLFFWCARPAPSGGETLLADSRRVLARLPPALRDTFLRKGVLYRRELGPPLGMAWQYVFQCDRREEVDALCRAAGYKVVWRSDERVSLSRVAQAVATHPVTGDACWFNHALFFHESSLPSGIRDGLRTLYGDSYLPHASFYGDGSPIDPQALADLRAAHRHCERKLPLQKDDVLIIDNLLMAHGRCAYEGPRDIRLTMGKTIE